MLSDSAREAHDENRRAVLDAEYKAYSHRLDESTQYLRQRDLIVHELERDGLRPTETAVLLEVPGTEVALALRSRRI